MSSPRAGTPTQSCANCKFWLKQPTPQQTASYGSCRRYPPATSARLVSGANASSQTETFSVNVFPILISTDWCGEWQTAPPGP